MPLRSAMFSGCVNSRTGEHACSLMRQNASIVHQATYLKSDGAYHPLMVKPQLFDIASADQLSSGLIVTFNDGRLALFPSQFLYNNIESVQEIFEPEDDQEVHDPLTTISDIHLLHPSADARP